MEFYPLFDQMPKGKVEYDLSEMSFNTWGDAELFCTLTFGDSYLGLDIASDKGTICSISGFSSTQLWKKSDLTLPKASKGTLKLTPINIVNGCGRSYPGEWCVYCDFKKKLVLIAEAGYEKIERADLQTVLFLENATGVLAEKKLVAVYIENVKVSA